MPKKIIGKILLILGLLLVAFLIYRFYKDRLAGTLPAIRPPAGNIAQELKKSTNETDFPLKIADGFNLSIFAEGLGAPRVLTEDPNANLLVSIPSRGQVLALLDGNGDGVSETSKIVAEGLNRPHGLAFFCEETCTLFVAETDKVTAFDYDQETLEATNPRTIVDLPSGGNHFTRTIIVTDDEKLLISVGSSCNVCEESDERRSKILVSNLDGSGVEVFSSGLRNAVFMRENPETGQIWVTEMGRDHLGDNLPPDEVNILEAGKDYGWPYCYGRGVHDADFDPSGKMKNFCEETVPSQINLPAHSAPLGLAFVPSNSPWPREYWGNLLVSYHGSWNRSVPTGYKIAKFDISDQNPQEEDFISGWLLDPESSLGRPVDVIFSKKGDRAYISDDKAGVVYTLTPKS